MHFKGLAYRAHNPAWFFSPLARDCSKLKGGRFNPKGISTFYLSLSQTWSLAEYNQGFPHRPQSATLCTYRINCDDIVNLKDPNERK